MPGFRSLRFPHGSPSRAEGAQGWGPNQGSSTTEGYVGEGTGAGDARERAFGPAMTEGTAKRPGY